MNGGKKTSKKPASKTLPHGDFHIEYTEYSMWDGASPNANQSSEHNAQINKYQMWELACLRKRYCSNTCSD